MLIRSSHIDATSTLPVFIEKSAIIGKFLGISAPKFITKSNTKLSLEGFYKKYDNYPYLVRNSISLANLGADFGVIGDEPVTSSSKGRTYGLEFFAQRKLTKGIYGLLSYTFSYILGTEQNK